MSYGKKVSVPRTLQADSRNKRHTVIFDIDGVVCDNHQENLQYRKDLEERGVDWSDPAVWDEFHRPDFRSHPGWVALTRALYKAGYLVVFLTARNKKWRGDTQTWLHREGALFELLLMWDPDSYAWSEYKGQVVAELMKECNIMLAIDDNRRHAAMYRELGIPTILALPEHDVR